MASGGPRPPDRAPRPPAGPGKLANRQDMSQVGGIPGAPGGTQGAYAPTGMPYGQASAALNAQKAIPLPQATSGVPAPAVPASAPPVMTGSPGPSANTSPGPQYSPTPGFPSIHDLMNRPTNQPMQPVTAGLPIGAGPGPAPTPSPAGKVLAYLASTPFASDAVKDLALRVDRAGVNW